MAQRNKSVKGPFGIIDLGSSKLACLIAEASADREINFIGQAIHAADGIRNGEITDMDLFSTAIGRTVAAAERNAGITIKTIHIVTPAGKPQLSNHKAEMPLPDQMVSRRDMRRLAIEQAEAKAPEGYVIAQRQIYDYSIDGKGGIDNPNGMSGSHLTMSFSLLALQKNSHANLCQAVRLNHLQIGHIHHSAAVSGLSCLTEDSRNLGTLIIDFGGGTTSLALFLQGKIKHASTVRMGGQNITRDIARMLSISTADAERIKAIEGSVLPGLIQASAPVRMAFPTQGDNFVRSNVNIEQDMISLDTGQAVQRHLLVDIIRIRLEEILEAVDQQLYQAGLPTAKHYNLAITGGASQITGLPDFLTDYWKKPISMSTPTALSDPDGQISGGSFAASIGMALFVQRTEEESRSDPAVNAVGKGSFSRLRNWFKQNI